MNQTYLTIIDMCRDIKTNKIDENKLLEKLQTTPYGSQEYHRVKDAYYALINTKYNLPRATEIRVPKLLTDKERDEVKNLIKSYEVPVRAKNTTLLDTAITGISERTANEIIEQLDKMQFNNIAHRIAIDTEAMKIKRLESEINDMFRKVALGEPLSEYERHMFRAEKMRQVYRTVEDRYKKFRTVNVQDIDHIYGTIIVCTYKGGYYWLDLNMCQNIADIANYKHITGVLYWELIKEMRRDKSTQEYAIEYFYYPENVSGNGYKNTFTADDWERVNQAITLPQTINIK